ncbi:hypothetical protein QIA37_05065 (plasmid) [Borrelia sp. CA_690]|nr:hypothetical protein [Borrelia maritima]
MIKKVWLALISVNQFLVGGEGEKTNHPDSNCGIKNTILKLSDVR